MRRGDRLAVDVFKFKIERQHFGILDIAASCVSSHRFTQDGEARVSESLARESKKVLALTVIAPILFRNRRDFYTDLQVECTTWSNQWYGTLLQI